MESLVKRKGSQLLKLVCKLQQSLASDHILTPILPVFHRIDLLWTWAGSLSLHGSFLEPLLLLGKSHTFLQTQPIHLSHFCMGCKERLMSLDYQFICSSLLLHETKKHFFVSPSSSCIGLISSSLNTDSHISSPTIPDYQHRTVLPSELQLASTYHLGSASPRPSWILSYPPFIALPIQQLTWNCTVSGLVESSFKTWSWTFCSLRRQFKSLQWPIRPSLFRSLFLSNNLFNYFSFS